MGQTEAHDEATVDLGDSAMAHQPHADRGSGDLLGRYLVIESAALPGSEGCALQLARAYDPRLGREVTLVQLHGAEPHHAARHSFVRRARAVGQSSHPNLTDVYDVDELGDFGVAVAMELVQGVCLTTWIRRDAPSWQQIVARFVEIGRGLAAVHDAGLVLGDFNPSKATVTTHGESEPRAKLGLAPPIRDAELSRDDLDPTSYLAPEQHAGREPTAAADQYALCVALWEALTSLAPPADAAKRPGSRRGIPGALSAIVLRGLRPEPDKRWPTMTALTDRLEQIARRPRRAWAAVGAVVLVAGTTAGAWASRADAYAVDCDGGREQIERLWGTQQRTAVRSAFEATGLEYASDLWPATASQLDGYAASWESLYRESCEATAAGQQSEGNLDLTMGCLRRARVSLETLVAALEDIDSQSLSRAHVLLQTLPPLARCEDAEALRSEVPPPRPEDAETARWVSDRLIEASTLGKSGKLEEAAAVLDEAQAKVATLDYPPIETEAEIALGERAATEGDPERAIEHARTAVALGLRWGQWKATAFALSSLAYDVGYVQARSDEGLAYARLARALGRLQGRHDDLLDEATLEANVGSILYQQGDFAGAERQQREALRLRENDVSPDGGLHSALLHANIAVTLDAQGKHDEAEPQFRTAIDALESLLGPNHPELAHARSSLANCLESQGRYDEALSELRTAISIWERALGPDHLDVAAGHNNLGVVLQGLGRHEEAGVEYEQALRIWESTLGPDHPYVAGTLANLASVVEVTGTDEEAEAAARAAMERQQRVLGDRHPELAQILHQLAQVLARQGEYAEAESLHRRAVGIRREALGLRHPLTRASLNSLGGFLLDRGRPQEALTVLRDAHAHLDALGARPGLRARIAFNLARAYWDNDIDRPRARRLAQQAVALYKDAGPSSDESRRGVRRWLDEHPR